MSQPPSHFFGPLNVIVSLFQSVPDIIFTKDSNLGFSEVNPAMEKTFGLAASDIVGRSPEQIYGAATGERIRAWDQRVPVGRDNRRRAHGACEG